MGLFYKKTAKEILEIRNKIVLQTAIPTLLKSGFSKSPFSTSWNGRNNLNDFEYELCRLTSNSQLEIIEIYIARGDMRIRFNINIFELQPYVDTIAELNGIDGLQYKLPPNSLTELKMRWDEIKGPPIFRLKYTNGHKLKRFYTKRGLDRNIERLTKTIETDLNNIDYFIKCWHNLHRPMTTDWIGQPM